MTTSGRSDRTPIIVGAVISVLVTAFFLLTFWNRFLGLRSGDGFFSGAVAMLRNGGTFSGVGYGSAPPLFLYRSYAVLALFGPTMTALRAAGIVERLLLTLLLYGWLVRLFRARTAALATIVTMIISTSDMADPLSSYNHFTILLGMAAGFVSSFVLDENRPPYALLTLGCGAGILSFLCLASKQTIGGMVTLAIPVVVGACLVRLDGQRSAAKYLVGFAVAWLTPCALFAAWMISKGSLGAFLRQIFITAPAAKFSNPIDFVTRALYVMGLMKWEVVVGVILILLCWRSVQKWGTIPHEPDYAGPNSMLTMGAILLLGIAAIGLALIVPSSFRMQSLTPEPIYLADFGVHIVKPLIYVALFGTGSLILFYGWLFFKRSLSRRNAQFVLFATVSFCIAFALSLSYPAFEAMTIPGIALFVAALLEDIADWRKWAIYAACAVILFLETQLKTFAPFEFCDWQEPPVAVATQQSSLPELKGMLLPANTVDFVDNTVRIVNENTLPGETIFTYPELAFFYGATKRGAPTVAGSHNIDVVPDAFAKEEASRLLAHPPAVLIYGPQSEEFLKGQEQLWRNGHPSGQRDLIAAVETLATRYQLAATFKVYPNGHPVYVFVRPTPERHSANDSQPR